MPDGISQHGPLAALQDGEAAAALWATLPADAAPADGQQGAATGKQQRQHLLHPGYFTGLEGPTYTPAPPEALIDAREWGASVPTVRGLVDSAELSVGCVFMC